MRHAFFAAVIAAALLTAPAQAQLRADLPGGPAPVALSDAPGPLSLGGLFNANTLRLSHSYEFSYSALGGASLGLGVYTTSLRWQPTDRLAARVDVGVAHSPFGDDALRQGLGFTADAPARPFLRNAELAYRPTDNSVVHLRVQQSPFGAYASPYYGYPGYAPYGYAPYGYAPGFGAGLHARYASDPGDLFWRDGQ